MNGKVDEQISGLLDGDFEPGAEELLLRRLAADPGLRERWGRYALIRDAVSGHLPERVDPGFAARVMAAVEAGPEPATGAAVGHRSLRAGLPASWWRPVAGLAVAASVAAAALVGVSRLELREDGGQAPRLAAVDVPADVPASSRPVAAGTRWDLRRPQVAARLNAYLVNHTEYTAGSSPYGMLSYTRIAGYDARR